MSVTVRKKALSSGVMSLYLDIYSNKKRHKEYLKDLKLYKATNAEERKSNKETLELAKEIAIKRAQELSSNGYDIVASYKGEIDFILYFENYLSKYNTKDKRNMKGACNKFKEFMTEKGIKNLSLKQLTENVVFKYAEYLKSVCMGEGASSYFARFKKMIKHAVREEDILINPAAFVTIKAEKSLVKDVLTTDEINILAKTKVGNEQVRNAFLFSCFTGLAWIDVKELKWKHIDMRNLMLKKTRAKSKELTSMQLHKSILSLLPEKGKSEEFVFTLPSHTAALKTLRNWLKKAEIEKHITFHCARHSFGTNLIYGNDVTVVSKLLAHASLKHTMRYVHIADEQKRNAINSLPEITV
jgi:integrase